MSNEHKLNDGVYIHTYQSRRRFQIADTERALGLIREITGWGDHVYGIPTDMKEVVIIGPEIYTVNADGKIREAIPENGKYHRFERSTLTFEELCSKINRYNGRG